MPRWWLILAVLAVLPPQARAVEHTDGGPDAVAYGQALGYPVAPRGKANEQRFMVSSYSHFDAVYPARMVAKPAVPSPLRTDPVPLTLEYPFRGHVHTLDDYLARNPTTGLLIARNGTILFERYQYGRTQADRMLSQSMVKTVVAMLVGIAVAEQAIRSVDDVAGAYLPELAETELGRTPIRALLQMNAGLQFTETYDGTDDNARLGALLFARGGPGPVAAVAQFNTRVAPLGALWHYAGLNTEVLGLVLARATGQSVSAYLQSRIWQPMGAEADASWTIDYSGQEIAYCCLSATLRDYARLGLMLAAGGAANGRQIIPRSWLEAAATASDSNTSVAPGPAGSSWGYGYQVWLMPGPRRNLALMGVHGQRILVDRAAGLVLVHTAVRLKPGTDDGDVELIALWRALLRKLVP